MKDSSDNESIVEMTQLELDNLWISVFGEPYRDEEMLSWDNLKWTGKEIVSIEAN